jgi:putative intracellular protease/amidase
MNILMVLTSHNKLGDTGKKTGFWLEEFAAPYYVFKNAGAQVTLASPKGGQPPLEPSSDADDAQTEATKRFKGDKAAQSEDRVPPRGVGAGPSGGLSRRVRRPRRAG